MKGKTNTNKAIVTECLDLVEKKELTIIIPEAMIQKMGLIEGDDVVFIEDGDRVLIRKA